MADETTLYVELEPPVSFTCADGTGIEKGALLTLSDPMTVATTTGDTDAIIGIAAEEKIASDGKTKIAVYLRGIFKGVAGAAGTTAGQALISDTGTGTANELVNADVNSEHLVGRALETATDRQTFLFLLSPFSVNLA
jgi:hypothetical protein